MPVPGIPSRLPLYLRQPSQTGQQGQQPRQHRSRAHHIPGDLTQTAAAPMVATAVCAMVLMARTPAARHHLFHPCCFIRSFPPGRGPGDSGPAQSCQWPHAPGRRSPAPPAPSGRPAPHRSAGYSLSEWRSVPCPAPSAAGSNGRPGYRWSATGCPPTAPPPR